MMPACAHPGDPPGPRGQLGPASSTPWTPPAWPLLGWAQVATREPAECVLACLPSPRAPPLSQIPGISQGRGRGLTRNGEEAQRWPVAGFSRGPSAPRTLPAGLTSRAPPQQELPLSWTHSPQAHPHPSRGWRPSAPHTSGPGAGWRFSPVKARGHHSADLQAEQTLPPKRPLMRTRPGRCPRSGSPGSHRCDASGGEPVRRRPTGWNSRPRRGDLRGLPRRHRIAAPPGRAGSSTQLRKINTRASHTPAVRGHPPRPPPPAPSSPRCRGEGVPRPPAGLSLSWGRGVRPPPCPALPGPLPFPGDQARPAPPQLTAGSVTALLDGRCSEGPF